MFYYVCLLLLFGFPLYQVNHKNYLRTNLICEEVKEERLVKAPAQTTPKISKKKKKNNGLKKYTQSKHQSNKSINQKAIERLTPLIRKNSNSMLTPSRPL
mmetsp:Transcript_46331/g.67717  ORF Transcript_46331/g.67717 Transcript_46331/m.67717 type:complete len:100 (-) Transcript_46331:607-906(-)